MSLAAAFVFGAHSLVARRFGRWAIGAALLWTVVGVAGPHLFGKTSLIGSLIEAVFGTVIAAATVLFCAGVGAYVAGRTVLNAERAPKKQARYDSRRDPHRVPASDPFERPQNW